MECPINPTEKGPLQREHVEPSNGKVSEKVSKFHEALSLAALLPKQFDAEQQVFRP